MYQVDVDSIPAISHVSYGYAKQWIQTYAVEQQYELMFVFASSNPDEEVFVLKRNGQRVRTISMHEE